MEACDRCQQRDALPVVGGMLGSQRSSASACRPCPRSHRKCCGWQHILASIAQSSLLGRIQSLDVLSSRANPKGVRLPPVVEARVFDVNGKEGLLYVVQLSFTQELR